MKKLFTIFFLLFTATAFGTSNRAGEITYTHISGLTYEITATVYVDANFPSNPSFLGFRVCGNLGSIPLVSSTLINATTLKNTYVLQHTFPGPSPPICELVIEDPNRNANIQNIPNAINTVFYIESELLINPFLGTNNSPLFLVQNSVDTACLNVINYYNFGGTDPDGDSLYYTLDASRTQGGMNVPGYFLPPASNSFSLNNFTGELTWDTPINLGGLYNFVVKVEEFRSGQKIGSIDREIQLDVKPSCTTVGINNKENKELFQLYPNPTQNKITLTSEEKIASSELVLMHYDGAIVPVKIRYNAHLIELDLKELNSGIYILTGQINNTFISKKIIKQ